MPLKLRIPRPRRKALLLGGGLFLAVSCAIAVWILLPFWQLSGQFADLHQRQPSRLYGRSPLLTVDGRADLEALAERFRGEGYQSVAGEGELPPGSFRAGRGRLEVHLRPFPTPAGPAGDAVLDVRLRGRRVAALTLDGAAVTSALLDPPLLASYYGDALNERRPVRVRELPPHVINAVLAAEDDRFFDHSGVSIAGVARAAWMNLFGDGVRQGGSTLTQQLVKNLYLGPERTFGRKSREAILALMLDARYRKEQILEAYLNEIYLGASGGVNLIGVGAAARAYFGREPGELTLAEAATLAGMIPAPANRTPVSDPEVAKKHRNLVLERMAKLEMVSPEQARAAMDQAVVARPIPPRRRGVPYFADAMAREAAARWGLDDLSEGGFVLLSTLEGADQNKAEEAVSWGLEALEEGWEKGRDMPSPLQAAMVSVDPRDGSIVAYVGGRDYGSSQFDRAGQARRQAGSAFKPVIYATAFERGVASPSSMVEDAPLTVRLANQRWSPQNDDGEFNGWVSVRTAVERSLNVPTARLALQVGLKPIIEVARGLGVTAPLDPVPSLALGAFEVSPVEMATVYATFAAGGKRPPVHGLAAILDPSGEPMLGEPLPAPEQVISPEGAYLMTSVLQGVFDRGTARVTRDWGLTDRLAGKTGTSNGRRDSWFAGYAPNRATAVWVGYDDNSKTRMSGGRAALPIWARFTVRVRPSGGYSTFRQPAGVVTAVVDPESGGLATDRCPLVETEVFLRNQVPEYVCDLHGRGYREERWDRRRPVERRHPFRRWLKRVFGDG
ncbi:MAG: PBP1A family penicillin-binding protein [Acidobacteriota bacterium]